MRDAFGGTFMIQVFIVFILIYISFTALALNYAKAFKAKNIIVNYLENNEIANLNESAELKQEMEDYFTKELLVGLNYKTSKDVCEGEEDNESFMCSPIGFKIERSDKMYDKKPFPQNNEGFYYTVYTYVGWDLGFLNPLLQLGGNNETPGHVPGFWTISGQTRLIVNE